jgi:hypothetical protein
MKRLIDPSRLIHLFRSLVLISLRHDQTHQFSLAQREMMSSLSDRHHCNQLNQSPLKSLLANQENEPLNLPYEENSCAASPLYDSAVPLPPAVP